MKKIKYLAVSTLALLAPAMALAQGSNFFSDFQLGDVKNIITGALKFISGIIFVIAVIMLLWSAFLFMTGAGDDEKRGKAKQYLWFALIGIAVAVLAFAAVSFIQSLLKLS